MGLKDIKYYQLLDLLQLLYFIIILYFLLILHKILDLIHLNQFPPFKMYGDQLN